MLVQYENSLAADNDVMCYVQNNLSQLRYLTSAVNVVQSFLTQSSGKLAGN